MAQWLRALAAPAEDPSSDPNTLPTLPLLTTHVILVPEDRSPSADLCRHKAHSGTHTNV